MASLALYYRLYTPNGTIPCRFAVDSNDPNLSAINPNLLTPPYTVENITKFILKRENFEDKSARAMVYAEHKDTTPAPGDMIIDIIDGPSTKAITAIRIVLPVECGQLPLWTLTARYTVSEEKVNVWLASGKYLHENTKEPVAYLLFSPGDELTTDLMRYRLDTPGWKDVWKVTNVANGKVGYAEAYEDDSYFTRTKNVISVQKPIPCPADWTLEMVEYSVLQ